MHPTNQYHTTNTRHNLCSPKEVPGLRARGDTARLFGQVKFYARDDAAEEQATAAAAVAAEAAEGGQEGIVAASVEVFEDACENLGEMLSNVVQVRACGVVDVGWRWLCRGVCVGRPGSGSPTTTLNTHTQTASQPIESLLLPQDFAGGGAGADAKGPGSLEAGHADGGDEEDEKFYESALPDGWDVGVDGKFVDVTTAVTTEERPTRSTGWTPWRLF